MARQVPPDPSSHCPRLGPPKEPCTPETPSGIRVETAGNCHRRRSFLFVSRWAMLRPGHRCGGAVRPPHRRVPPRDVRHDPAGAVDRVEPFERGRLPAICPAVGTCVLIPVSRAWMGLSVCVNPSKHCLCLCGWVCRGACLSIWVSSTRGAVRQSPSVHDSQRVEPRHPPSTFWKFSAHHRIPNSPNPMQRPLSHWGQPLPPTQGAGAGIRVTGSATSWRSA